jgi:hypothetical protein
MDPQTESASSQRSKGPGNSPQPGWATRGSSGNGDLRALRRSENHPTKRKRTRTRLPFVLCDDWREDRLRCCARRRGRPPDRAAAGVGPRDVITLDRQTGRAYAGYEVIIDGAAVDARLHDRHGVVSSVDSFRLPVLL